MCLWLALIASRPAFTDEQAVLSPRWTCEIPSGIEWCEPIETNGRRTLLICDKQVRLSLLDMNAAGINSNRATEEGVQLTAGVKFAGRTENVVYLNSQTDIHVLRVEAPRDDDAAPRLSRLWHLPSSLERPTNADPEFLLRIVAAWPFADGLLVLRSDGACVLLRAADGEATRRRRFPPTSVCELHVAGEHAALWRKHEHGLHVAFFNPVHEEVEPRAIELPLPPPIWSDLCDAGLTLLWTDRFGLVCPDGEAWTQPLPSDVCATANTVCVVSPDGGPRNDEHPGRSRPCLFTPAADGHLWACELRTRRELFEKVDAKSGDNRPIHPRRLLESAGVLLLEHWMDEVAAYQPRSAEPWLTIRRSGATVRGAHVRADVLYALFAEEADADSSERSASGATLRLCRESLPDARQTTQPTARPISRGSFRIDAAPDARALWIEDALLLIENERIRAYTLP